jgi:hypothetical protein
MIENDDNVIHLPFARNGASGPDAAQTTPTPDALMRTQPFLRPLPTATDLRNWQLAAQVDPNAAAELAAYLARLKELQRAAADDKHNVIVPTHIAEKDGRVIGYASIGALPLVNVWLDSKAGKPRDTLNLLNQVENEAYRQGHRTICMPCWNGSPLRPFMETQFGYKHLMESGYYVKKLR